MPVRLDALSLRAQDPARLARFWHELLGGDAVRERAEGEYEFTPASNPGLPLRFLPGAAPKSSQNRQHFDLTSESPADQEAMVARALALGARHTDVGQRPEEGHRVLADPEGNEFCVIEPGNRFLAGCGRIGALACDGSHAVGVFWSAALGWPLVWDEGEETAVQSPDGGTKFTWGGPPLMPRTQADRFAPDLVPEAPAAYEAEAARLTSLGARVLRREAGHAVLADPDGNAFRLLTGRA
ncbi:VOC family protein [Streptomyces sp. NEAU-H3]|uniref:VOC family protein n=1 Tax=Streptomyces sp. NEAU-H3 TaxID=2720636 RepID=UPI001438994C|nr:VOC family protein [Streptomyces sp. NEAU-H3]NJA59368.1 VOC family protein [Streptomyces sp. NEAU-H3]